MQKVKFATAGGGEVAVAKDAGDKKRKKYKEKKKHEAVSDDAVKLVRKQLAGVGCKLWVRR
jgi:hypothetical protein